MPEIKKIVLTGGPCAGKTTALVKIVEYFSGMGYKVFTVPEVPTLYSTGGWNYLTPNRQLYYQGERAILETQLALENQFVALAEVCKTCAGGLRSWCAGHFRLYQTRRVGGDNCDGRYGLRASA